MGTRTLPPGTRTTTQTTSGDVWWMVEYAKSGRAKCSVCHQLIPNKALRLGEGHDHGTGGPQYKFQHWTCVTDGTISRIGTSDKLRGLLKLTKPDQDTVRVRFSGGAGGKAFKGKARTLRD